MMPTTAKGAEYDDSGCGEADPAFEVTRERELPPLMLRAPAMQSKVTSRVEAMSLVG
jgi:hypothetical protein